MPDELEIETPEGVKNVKLSVINILVPVLFAVVGWAFAGGAKSQDLTNLTTSVASMNIKMDSMSSSFSTRMDAMQSNYVSIDKTTALEISGLKSEVENLSATVKNLQTEITAIETRRTEK